MLIVNRKSLWIYLSVFGGKCVLYKNVKQVFLAKFIFIYNLGAFVKLIFLPIYNVDDLCK